MDKIIMKKYILNKRIYNKLIQNNKLIKTNFMYIINDVEKQIYESMKNLQYKDISKDVTKEIVHKPIFMKPVPPKPIVSKELTHKTQTTTVRRDFFKSLLGYKH